MDSTSNPQEIGAFINDSCVGASTVLDSDTNVLVPGYIEGMSGEVTFEEYYDSLKSNKPAIKQYFVNNNKTGTWKKRTINTNERQDYYLISFKNEKIISNEILDNPVSISCSPNPLKGNSLINYYVPEKSMVKISVYDFYGRQLNILYNGVSKNGDFNMQWNGTNSNGKKLPNGVYIIKLKAEKYQAQTKIIVIK
ncbi:MAG: T9SS type A sorting domain-containing protein [Bacteroidales bacterium]|nr:T9SS type A sorting domain-containing protein [Bacteroidales bacterium]